MPIQPAQLEAVSVDRITFVVNRDFDPADAGLISYEVAPEVSISELDRTDEGLRGGVTVRARIELSRTDDEGGEGEEAPQRGAVPFELDVEASGVFVWDSATAPGDDLGRGWLEYNGMYLIWPYLRSYVASITGMSYLPALTIYTMNVPKPPMIEDAEPGDDQSGQPADEPADADAALHADDQHAE